MNDEKIMDQIRSLCISLYEIKDIRNTQPYSFHNLFMFLCRYVDQLKLDENKLTYVKELKEMFTDFQSKWVDIQTSWNPEKDKQYKKEIFDALEKNLVKFDKIIDRKIELDNLKVDIDSLEETRKANKKSNIAIAIAIVSIAISIVLSLILHYI
ncbi:MAG TPA: hypothetical protein VMZ29_09315 [Candidatus Bathyarchaeia archaeon]|nr:hypothetical protein [Candidatus Bathyarchaeia archaeon]